MKFRPCIDIHNGKVKQIVGGSLKDAGDKAKENFVSEYDAEFYAKMYKKDNVKGGHIIILNPVTSEYYDTTKEQAFLALKSYPDGLQIGGGITDENALEFIDAGATHVIITSFVFKNGKVNYENLYKVENKIGKENLVLDLSCRKKDGKYYIVTDRWQIFTDEIITYELLNDLSEHCSEFLIHAVDVEGTASGIEEELVGFLGKWKKDFPMTYAGGIKSMEDIKKLRTLGNEKLDFTVGSALDLFGGNLSYSDIIL